jgi:hypothetical protein
VAERSNRRTNYLRAAVANAYNITALAGISAAALFTGDTWLFGIGAALEAVWLAVAPGNPRFRRAVDNRLSTEARTESLRQMQDQVALLPSEERQKVQAVSSRVAEVKAEVIRNPRLQGAFMEEQVRRLEELVIEYIHIAVTSYRCESYITRSDTRQINRERDSWRQAAEHATDDIARDLAAQNVTILEKRLAIGEDLSKFIARARGQLSLIQNTVALLRDQVMTMTTPQALTAQLDELLVSIDAMRQTTQEINAVVSGTSLRPHSLDPATAPNAEFAENGRADSAGRVRE